MNEIRTRVTVGPDHRISRTAPAEVPAGEHEVIIKARLLKVDSRGGDSGAAYDVIEAAGWSGGQRAWELPTRLIYGYVLLLG